ncbi:MAG: hypothetical protein KDE31_30665, partial [Caldilineaceae bacterium]|nr:hypothetical protein [Caldilineaceae bacterium]
EFAAEARRHIPLKDGTVTIPEHNVPEVGMNQTHYVRRAGVTLALHFERLPDCLVQLPFVDKHNVPPFPHKEERGVRPPGTFFDHFKAEDEAAVWEHADDDFATFGYQRYSSLLPAGTADAVKL